MSVILVVEQDASYAERIVETLKQEGWDAKRLADRSAAIEAASSQMPRLVIASATQPEGTDLLRSFSRQEGGPGSVALIPVGFAQQASPADFQADEILAKPFSDDDLKQIVRRCLNAPPASAPPKIAKKGKQLTSAEIFGDVLAEVEAEARRSKARRPARTQQESSEELDRKLEETLSGVLPIGGRLRRPGEAKARPSEPAPKPASPTPRVASKPRNDLPSENEIDDLLDKTLSSLELPQRTRREKKAAPERPVEKLVAPAEPFDPGPKPDPFSPAPDSLFPPLPAVPEPDVPVSEAPTSQPEPTAPAESLGFEPTDTFELEDSPPLATPVSESLDGRSDPWQGIEPPPDLYPSSFEAAPEAAAPDNTAAAATSAEELLQPLESPEDLPLLPESAPAADAPAPSAAAGDPFSFTDAFVPPAPETAGNGESLSNPLSFTDTFIPPDPKSVASPDSGLTHPPAQEDSFPSYEPPASSSRSFLDDSADVAAVAAPATTKPEATEPTASEEAPGAKEEGQIFGDYTLLDKIATGGMAEVWRARRRGVEGFQKTVAIKKILGHLTDSPDFVNMFIDEAKLAAQLNHNNIIQIYDLGKEGEDFFIAMEHVDGKDLRSILTTGKKLGQPLPIGLALLIVASLARALDYAHRRRDFEDRPLGLVHRDVSPQNVLISYEGEIKLCDFGIVKAVSKASTTQMGALKGKLQYMSPEQAWGKKVDGRSDIFSVGSVLFEVLTGTKLFTGDNEISVLDAVRECKIRSPLEVVPDLPPAIDDIVKKALAKAPEDRYQTAGDLEADLMSVLNTLQPTPSANGLATYLGSIFQQPEPQFPSYEVSQEREPPAEAAAHDAEKAPADEAPAGPSAKEGASGSPVKTILLVVLALLLLGALGFAAWKLTSGSQEPTTSPAPPPPAAAPVLTPEAPADETEAVSPAEPNATPPASDPETDEAESGGGTSATADEPGAEGGDRDLDLERLVEDGLAEQEELLQKRLEEEYEARRRQLQEEISRTQQSFQEEESGEAASEPPPDGRR